MKTQTKQPFSVLEEQMEKEELERVLSTYEKNQLLKKSFGDNFRVFYLPEKENTSFFIYDEVEPQFIVKGLCSKVQVGELKEGECLFIKIYSEKYSSKAKKYEFLYKQKTGKKVIIDCVRK